jgi:hypothetical protein
VSATVHHTVGVMVWGAISHGSRSRSLFIRGIAQPQRYINERNIEECIFQQDNARPHIARSSLVVLEEE